MRVLPFDSNKKNMSARELVDLISDKVPRQVQVDILKRTFPQGKVRNNEFTLGSLHGEQGKSLKIDIDPRSPYFMKGQDFDGGVGVGGIVKILMEGQGLRLPEIKDMFAEYIDETRSFVRDNPPENPVKPQIDHKTPYDAEYKYLNSDSDTICLVRKYLVRDGAGNPVLDSHGKAKKEFRQFTNNHPYPRMPDVRPLYNIPNVIASDKVIWVEGEKCADALNDKGYTATCTMGGAGMLTKKSATQYDFSPLQGKNVTLWQDNDTAGKRVAELVQELSLNAGARSVTMLTPPRGKPEGWDAADAIAENFDIDKFLIGASKNVKQNINLLDDSLLISRFTGKAPEQKFLVDGTFPLNVPIILSASGDAGKGMLTLDLGMKVASGLPGENSFGGIVKEFGNVVIFTAEDDESEMHRRIERLDPDGKRFHYEHEIRIVSLPNFGGVFPIMQNIHGDYTTSQEFERIYEQISQISNLKLIVFDPLASFVHADVNADPAAGAALTGLLSQIGSETGASVMMCHHMTKIKDDMVVSTPEQARNLIRGTSALVDGVRCAFTLWQLDEKSAKRQCTELNIEYQRNRCFNGAIVKSNGPANRTIRKFVRDTYTGLLVDRTDEIEQLNMGTGRDTRKTALYEWVARCEREGRALCQQGSADGILKRMTDADSPEALHNLSQRVVDGIVRELLVEGRINKYSFSTSGGRKWLGTMSGVMSRGEYEATTARDNI